MTAHGASNHDAFIHLPSGSLFLGDGWGVFYAALRFRRYDLASGRELASIRTGTSVRCLQFLDDGQELLAATDTKLWRLGTAALDLRERWDRLVPRYSDSIVVRDQLAVVANWRQPKFAMVDLATGRVRRRPGPALMTILDARIGPVLVGGEAGGVMLLDLKRAETTDLIDTPPALAAVLAPDGESLWITVGVRHQTPHTRELRAYPLASGAEPAVYELPIPVGPVVAGQMSVWLAHAEHLLMLNASDGFRTARSWRAPAGHGVLAFDPDERLVLTTSESNPAASSSRLTCFRVEGAA
ncbi:MAG: hypothetical protein ACRDGI_09100 [Candidatus Limnocylindrales bacterium]